MTPPPLQVLLDRSAILLVARSRAEREAARAPIAGVEPLIGPEDVP